MQYSARRALAEYFSRRFLFCAADFSSVLMSVSVNAQISQCNKKYVQKIHNAAIFLALDMINSPRKARNKQFMLAYIRIFTNGNFDFFLKPVCFMLKKSLIEAMKFLTDFDFRFLKFREMKLFLQVPRQQTENIKQRKVRRHVRTQQVGQYKT